MNDLQRDYWQQLFANLVNASPVDTRNMQSHIVLFENANEYVIEINAPLNERKELISDSKKAKNFIFVFKKTNSRTKKAPAIKGTRQGVLSDYAYDVNYANYSPHKGWVQDQIELTAKIVNGRVIYLGGDN